MTHLNRLTILCAAAMLGVPAIAHAQEGGDNPPPPPPPSNQGEPGRPGQQMGPGGPRGNQGPGMRPEGRPGSQRMGGPGPGMGGMGGPGGPHQMGRMPAVDTTYLGVEASPVDPALRAQLKLPKGDGGLVVNFVDAKGPAGSAGIQEYDILTKLDDQLLVNPPQLRSLIQMHNDGDEVKLTLIRGGETQSITAKLTQKKMDPMPFGPPAGFGPPMGFGGPSPEVLERMQKAFQGAAQRSVTARSWTFRDPNLEIAIFAKDGKLMTTAKDRAGKTLYDGSLDAPADRAKLPPEVKQRLDDIAWNNLRSSVVETSPSGSSAAPTTQPAQ